MSTSAWIDVERKEGLRDRARAYKVMIDGQEAGTIRHGQQQSFEVVPGTHEVFLKIDWCRSPKRTVDVAGGGRAKVTCVPSGTIWTAIFAIVFKPTSYIRAEIAS
jgi:adenine-specific DNA methylase